MSSTKRLPVYAQNPPCADRKRLEVRQQQKAAARAERKKKPDRPEEFICYDNSDDDDDDNDIANEFTDHQILRTSYNFVDYIRNRESGLRGVKTFEEHYSSRHILTHDMFKEYPISLNNMNKVFCSQWLSDRQIVFGTKCNKLLVYDIHTQSLDHIPTISSRNAATEPEDHQSGIHFLQMNPSRSLLVTGATHSHQLAVYQLPTLDPIAIAENGHKDWVFDAVWLDDEFFVSGSRDSKLGLWHVSEQTRAFTNLPEYGSIKPVRMKDCKNAQKIRSLAFNKQRRELACLSLNGYIHVWNMENFKQSLSRRLPSSQENVCLAVKEDGTLYAIGCRSYTLLLDSRTLQPIRKILARYSGCGIRSASFQGNTLTIGTGIGMLMFYDLKANRYLESSINASRTVVLKTSRGFVFPDEEFADQGFHQMKYTPAIYTHCYDFSSTRLFAAGGPLPASMFGNYAGIWQ
uniref:DDB1- and CUL4-associated factor 12 n=1 Tax=Cacopsylla melanoneura TaxID=428564 RepID=A0A8D9ERN3_9HEMI